MSNGLVAFSDLPVEIGELIISLCDDDGLLALVKTNRYLNWLLIPILLRRLLQIDIQEGVIDANWCPDDPRRLRLLTLLNLWVYKPTLPTFKYTFFASSCQRFVSQYETETIAEFLHRISSIDTLSFQCLDNLAGATSAIRKHDSDLWRLNLVALLKLALHRRCRKLMLDRGPMSTYIHEPSSSRFTAAQSKDLASITSFINCPPTLEVLELRDSMMLLPFFLPHTLDLLRSQSSVLVELMICEDSLGGWKEFFASVSAPSLQQLVIKRKSFQEPFVVSFDLLFKFFHRHPALRRIKLDHIRIPKVVTPPIERTYLFPNLEYLDAHPTILATLLRYPPHFPKLCYISMSLTSYDGYDRAISVLSSELKYSMSIGTNPIPLSFAFNADKSFISWFRRQCESPNRLQYLKDLEEITVILETTWFGEMISFLHLLPDWLAPLTNLKVVRVGHPYHIDVCRRELRNLQGMRPALKIRLFDSLNSICGDRGLREQDL
ncbi:hypothetical protein AGABI1DRAFT_114637 [Agaricus bisporus var. burnettii JB137-S8]|uniref:F-box domain-containing protein n=1 Tax=Agaricus bisporus var. burnettii (strain JB137-S8 / ATCC MYA-4627 / FGSC 10392) TaxID=597362 RepID=K5WSE1_AGABU|nr:uncharacterized protein AGABI1DRAFT_114637 [Agaricus bisporus var. burnettii JB137-S8]EKM78336.1 hypothetical protein AGABI1DRAFT_114637 [Agaricus bisporus var. burnettii JB137-S8]